jgi:hypothetical protein
MLTLSAPALAAPTTAHLDEVSPTEPRCQPKGLSGFATPGGSLAPNNVYFYAVEAVVVSAGPTITPISPICRFVPVQTTPGNQSALLQWVQTPGATHYRVYRSDGLPDTFPSRLIVGPGGNDLIPAANVCPAALKRCSFPDSGAAPNSGNPAPRPAAAYPQAGGHPDLRIRQRIDYGGADPNSPLTGGDDPFEIITNPDSPQFGGANQALATDLFRWPPGLIANPRATARCALEGPNSLLGDRDTFGSQDPAEDTCPKNTFLGTVETITRIPAPGGGTRLSISLGDIYNGQLQGGEAGRLFIVVRPICSAGHAIAPGSAFCQGNLGGGSADNNRREVKKEFIAAVATVEERGEKDYGVNVETIDAETGGDLPAFQQVLVPNPGAGNEFFDAESPVGRSARIPRQLRQITQDLAGYADANTLSVADDVPFVTLPTSCGTHTMFVDKTTHDSATVATDSVDFVTENCSDVPFEPGLVQEVDTTQAEAPVSSATTVAFCPDPQVDNCQTTDDPIHQSHVRDIDAVFPRGLNVSAAAGNFIRAIGTEIGDISGFSDELGGLRGNIALGRVNPDGTFIIEIEVRPDRTDEQPEPETVVRFDALVRPDGTNGQVIAEFDDLPQVPFKWLELEFFGGERATLVNPPINGTHEVRLRLEPWSATEPVSVDDTFETTGAQSPRAFDPNLSAATEPSTANADAAMTLKITNPDRHQNLAGFQLRLPDGLLAKLALLKPCPTAQADAGTCSDEFQIGTVNITAGNGPTPLTLPGKVFSAEPMVAGDIASLSVVVPAVVGPFDLGTVISRSRIMLEPNRFGANVETVGNFPVILEGIPVRIRQIELNLQGLRTPPTCDVKQFVTAFTSAPDPTTEQTNAEGGVTTTVNTPYAATGCEGLAFEPKVSATVGTEAQPASVGSHPPFTTVVNQPDNQAVISSSRVSLPAGLNANPAALQGLCSQEQADARECPETSRVGDASATSPLINDPLAGPMYLVENPGGLPKLVMFLDGLISQRLEATTSLEGGRLVTTLSNLPATPVTRFVLNVNGGDRGLFTVANQLCSGQSIDGAFTAHTGQTASDSAPVSLTGSCVPVNEAGGGGAQPRLLASMRNLRGTPRVTLTALVAKTIANERRLSSLRVQLPSSLVVNTRRVSRGVIVRAGGRKLARSRWSLSSRGVLTIRQLPKARTIIQVRIERGAVRASRSLASRARGRRLLPRQTFTARVVNAANTRFDYRVRVLPRKR